MPRLVLSAAHYTVPNLRRQSLPGFADDFERPNAATLGAPWMQLQPAGATQTWSIVGGAAQQTAASAGFTMDVREGMVNSGTLTAKAKTLGASKAGGLVIRAKDALNCIYVTRRDSGVKRPALYLRQAGVASAYLGVGPAEMVDGDVLGANFLGTYIEVTVNGAPIFNVTTDFNLDATLHGLLGGNSALDVQWDNCIFTPTT